MKQTSALCTALLLLPMAHGANVNSDFAGLPKQRVDLGACAFSAPMEPDFSIRLTEGKAPQLANFHGKLIPGKTKRVEETWIRFTCEDTTAEVLDIYTSRTRSGDGQWSAPPPIDRKDVSYPQYLLLRGKNWDGAGVVRTSTGVDWDKRTRHLGFCLVHKARVLCGVAYDLQYEAWPKEDAQPYVLKFLQSIEFIDEPAPPAAAASAP